MALFAIYASFLDSVLDNLTVLTVGCLENHRKGQSKYFIEEIVSPTFVKDACATQSKIKCHVCRIIWLASKGRLKFKPCTLW